MVVPILPSKELKTEANYSKFTFKYAHKDGKTTELRELKMKAMALIKITLVLMVKGKLKAVTGNSGSPVFAIAKETNKYYYYGTVNYGSGEKVWGILHIDQVAQDTVGSKLTKAYKTILKTRLKLFIH